MNENIDVLFKRIKTRLLSEVENSSNLGNIRIDEEQIKQAKARRANLLRHDVPRAAFDKDGNKLPMPSDLKDDFNILYKDANGTLVAANYLLSDFDDRSKPSPSPVQPILNLKEFWPMLAAAPLMTLTGIHWIFGLAVWLGYAIYMRMFTKRSFISAAWQMAAGRRPILGLLVKLPIFLWLMFYAPGFLASAVLPLWVYLDARKWLSDQRVHDDGQARAKALFGQAQHLARTGLATQTYLEDQMHVIERQRQANAAAQDITPVIDIEATATGYFAAQGSLNSPDESKNMVFSGTDLGAAMLVVGTTGTGKTYTVLTPLMKELARINKMTTANNQKYGLFLMDDKGDLPPRGMDIFQDFKLISPEPFEDRVNNKTIKPSLFAPMEGLKAEQVTKLIGDIFSVSGEIWDKAAQEKFLYTLITMECALDMGLRCVPQVDKNNKALPQTLKVAWTLETLFRLVLSDAQMQSVLYAISAVDAQLTKEGKPSPLNEHPLMSTALRYFVENYKNLADGTKSSVNFNVSAWHTDSVNRHMKPWWTAETGVRIEDVFKGQTMGLYCPEFRYGLTGKLVNAMVRARLYNFVKNRSSTWEDGGTRVMLIWDEFSLGIGKGEMEANILPIQRSLGLTSVFATQTITEVRARMGRERADALLDNLTKNIICLATDAESYQFLASKMGTFRRLVPSSRSKEEPVALDYYGSQRAKALTGMDDIVIYNQDRLEHKSDPAKEKDTPGYFGTLFSVMRGTASEALQSSNHKFYTNVLDEDAYVRYIDAATLSMETAPIFDADELSRVLKFNFHAFMAVQRGGSQRFDIVRLGPKKKPEVQTTEVQTTKGQTA